MEDFKRQNKRIVKRKIFKLGLPIFFLTTTLFSHAQQGNNIVAHTIKQGETISSIARLYHTKKDDILRLNNLSDKTILRIGQKLVIPVGKNVAVNKPEAPQETKIIPNKNQYQIVAGDNLLKIARQHHVTEQQLMDWNGLKNDKIRAGSFLYVTNPGLTVKEPVLPAPDKKEDKKIDAEVKTAKLETEKKTEPQQIPVVKTTVPEKAPEKEVKTQPIITQPNPVVSVKNGDDFFKKEFATTSNSLEGTSGIFKTIAGLQDKKYYVLLNNVENGSIVKVSANNKSIYAKVLGPLPDIKEDKDLMLRISSVAADALGIVDKKFSAKVEF